MPSPRKSPRKSLEQEEAAMAEDAMEVDEPTTRLDSDDDDEEEEEDVTAASATPQPEDEMKSKKRGRPAKRSFGGAAAKKRQVEEEHTVGPDDPGEPEEVVEFEGDKNLDADGNPKEGLSSALISFIIFISTKILLFALNYCRKGTAPETFPLA